VKELKGFRRIHIKAGHKADISFTLKGEDLAFFNGTKLVTEHGEFDVWVGPDSDHGLHGEFIIR
jgi:beta-glucosidase